MNRRTLLLAALLAPIGGLVGADATRLNVVGADATRLNFPAQRFGPPIPPPGPPEPPPPPPDDVEPGGIRPDDVEPGGIRPDAPALSAEVRDHYDRALRFYSGVGWAAGEGESA